MIIIPIIFIVFFGSALLWACLAFYVQGNKLYRIWTEGTNGHERIMTGTYVFVSFMNAYFMHVILLASIRRMQTGEITDYSTVHLVDIYVVISLLLGTVGSGAVSWLILSKHTIELLSVIKMIDTDGHNFSDITQKKMILTQSVSLG